MMDQRGPLVRVTADSDPGDRSRAEFVFDKLREAIRSGRIQPGQRLREGEVAAWLNVSRTPVREAIGRLASNGLVQPAPPRGMVVVSLTRQEVLDLYVMREVLEGTAARLAAQHISEPEIAALRSLLNRGKAESEPEALAALNRQFHDRILLAAQNEFLKRALSVLADSIALLPGTTFTIEGRARSAYREHAAILRAIEERDVEKAEENARAHIRVALRLRLERMFFPGER
jgi:DNA-binding GntR family transcriptional regulator